MKKNIVGIITARGGSKGIKDKNISLIDGKPLINYTIESALSSELLSDFFVSTDSEKIANIAKDAGAPIPFMRPPELAKDETPTIDVVKHDIKKYEEINNVKVDSVVILQPTSPLRTKEDIDTSINIFLKHPESNSLISCCEGNYAHPNSMYKKNGEYFLPFLKNNVHPIRRQDLETVYIRNGAIFIASIELIFKHNKLIENNPLAYIMPRNRSINIDEYFDLEIAEFFIKRNKQNKNINKL